MEDVRNKRKQLEQGICPICGQKMKYGYIPASSIALQWFPDGKKVPTIRFQRGEGAVALTEVPFWKREKAPSYYCSACCVVITPVDKSLN